LKKYDELARCTNVLTEGIELEFHKCVTQQEKCRSKWYEAEKENHETKKYFAKYKADQDTLEVKLKMARHQLDNEMKKRLKAEQTLDHMERQVQLIKELLLDRDTGITLTNEDKQTLAHSIQQWNTMAESKLFGDQTDLQESFSDSASSSVNLGISYDISADDILDDTAGSLNDRRKSKRGPTAPPLDCPTSTTEDGSEGTYFTKRTRICEEEDCRGFTKTTEVNEWIV